MLYVHLSFIFYFRLSPYDRHPGPQERYMMVASYGHENYNHHPEFALSFKEVVLPDFISLLSNQVENKRTFGKKQIKITSVKLAAKEDEVRYQTEQIEIFLTIKIKIT